MRVGWRAARRARSAAWPLASFVVLQVPGVPAMAITSVAWLTSTPTLTSSPAPAVCVAVVVTMSHLACSECRDEERRRGPDLHDASSGARGAAGLRQPFGLAATRSATLSLATGLAP